MEKIIGESLNYLLKSQYTYGEIPTMISKSNKLDINTLYVSNLYTTTFSIYSISFIDTPIARKIENKALSFFCNEMEKEGIWRFFSTNRNIIINDKVNIYTQNGIIPDLDDIACISFSLRKNKIYYKNYHLFMNNRNEEELFYTWLFNIPPRMEYNELTTYIVPEKNDICSGVNANILLYLGENEDTKEVINWLVNIIKLDKENESMIYFHNKVVLYYLISRAYYNGVEGFKEVRKIIKDKILSEQKSDGAFESVMIAALAVCSLYNFSIEDNYIKKVVNYIIDSRNSDYSWNEESFYFDPGYKLYCGSKELTTSFCIEAISRYLKLYC